MEYTIPQLSLVPVHSNIETCMYMQPSPIYPRRGMLRRLTTTDIYITKNSITYNCKESLIPGILYKTISGYYFCQKKLTYDFMLRTNLSSFIIFPNIWIECIVVNSCFHIICLTNYIRNFPVLFPKLF